MNTNNENNSVGRLRISKDVIATIAATSACEVEGVNRLANATLEIKEMLAKGFIPKSVVVSLKDDFAQVELHLIIEQGVKIPVVSSKVQKAVKEAIQSMTSIAVSTVNIVIAGMAV